jgi:hypothetical protein
MRMHKKKCNKLCPDIHCGSQCKPEVAAGCQRTASSTGAACALFSRVCCRHVGTVARSVSLQATVSVIKAMLMITSFNRLCYNQTHKKISVVYNTAASKARNMLLDHLWRIHPGTLVYVLVGCRDPLHP